MHIENLVESCFKNNFLLFYPQQMSTLQAVGGDELKCKVTACSAPEQAHLNHKLDYSL